MKTPFMYDQKGFPVFSPSILHDILHRHGMTHQQLADYLYTPRATVRKWLDGSRQPSIAAIRLIEIMGIIESDAPDLHKQFL